MKLLAASALALLAKAVTSAPVSDIQGVEDYTFQLVNPVEGFSIKVPSQLYVVMCKDIEFGSPCYGGYVAPGLCYNTPTFGVSAIQPSKPISGCTGFTSKTCDSTEPHLSDIAYPGIADLVPPGFNDQLNSFICY